MSNQLHRGESDRRQQVKFRCDERLVEEFDEMVADSDEYDNRSDALRAGMVRMVDGGNFETPREPPAEEPLRSAYLALIPLTSPKGIVPHHVAVSELQSATGKSKTIIERRVLGKLANRGYIKHLTNWQGSARSWKVWGVDE